MVQLPCKNVPAVQLDVHALQAICPLASWNVFALQAVQLVWLLVPAVKVPGGQLAHIVLVVSVHADWMCLPAPHVVSQAVHAVALLTLLW